MSDKIVRCTVCNKNHSVSTEHLSKRTFIPHKVKCPVCGKEFELKWQAACSRQKEEVDESYCSTCLSKHTNLRIYGTEYPNQSKKVRQKTKQTCLKKYGTTSPLDKESSVRKENQEQFKARALKGVKTIMDRQGSPFSRKEVRHKARQTLILRYGADNIMKTEKGVSSFKATMMSKYGVFSAMQSEELKEKMSKACEKNNGAPWAAQCPKIREQMAKTCYERYGTIHPNIGKQSKEEKEISDYIKSLGFKVIDGYVGWNGAQEMDIYLPDLKIGFEYNGLYYHSSACHTDSSYHYKKSMAALNKGIRLFHLWSREDLSLLKSMVCSKLGKCKKIPARKLRVEKVNSVDANKFYLLNHLQGSVGTSSVHLGLYQGNELIACMSFRGVDSSTVELSRYATKQFTQVIGGFSKLWAHFERSNKKYTHAISFAMRDICPTENDTVYAKTGWIRTTEYTSQLFYTDGTRLLNRQHFMKQKLKDLWEWKPEYDKMTEAQICYLHGIFAIYNSGCWKFEKDLIPF